MTVRRWILFYGLAYEFIDIGHDAGLSYADAAFKTARKSGDTLKIIKAGRLKSLAFIEVMGRLNRKRMLSNDKRFNG